MEEISSKNYHIDVWFDLAQLHSKYENLIDVGWYTIMTMEENQFSVWVWWAKIVLDFPVL